MNRSFEILRQLLQRKTSTTILDLANEFQVSEKTVRNDLLSLDSLLSKYHLKMNRKPGKGVSIEGELIQKNCLLDYLRTQQCNRGYSSNERHSKLLLRLLSTMEPILIKELSLDFHVSRTTITNDVMLLNQKLRPYDLNIIYKQSEGLVVEGKEADKRKALSMFLPYELEQYKNAFPFESDSIADHQILLKLNKIFKVDMKNLEKILHDAESQLGYTFSTEAFINLMIHLAIAINRSQTGYAISLGNELKEKLKAYPQYVIAEITAKTIEKSFHIKFQECEVFYIALHFIGAKTIENLSDIDFKITLEQSDLEQAVMDFIRCVQEELRISLEQDIQLYNSLLLHLRPTINRMLYGLSLHNPLKADIIRSYPQIYSAIEISSVVLNNAYDITLPKDELTYLVLHVAAAMERSMKNTRVLIACASGIGMSQLLVARIERLFKNIEIVAVVSVLDVEKYKNKGIDLIISTIQFGETSGIKTIVVNPLLEECDIANIRINLHNEKRSTSAKDLFQAQHVYDIDYRLSKQDVLEFVNKQLIRQKKVTANYLKSLAHREKVGSTYIGYGIAVVHGDIKEVNTSCLQILRCNQPVEWDETSQVDFILNFNTTENDTELFSLLFKRIGIYLDEDCFWKVVKETKNKQELCTLLNKELLYDYK